MKNTSCHSRYTKEFNDRITSDYATCTNDYYIKAKIHFWAPENAASQILLGAQVQRVNAISFVHLLFNLVLLQMLNVTLTNTPVKKMVGEMFNRP